MLREEQIDLRRRRARSGRFLIENLGRKRVFSDYAVANPETGGRYVVQIRGFETGDNACSCPDFKSNTLGTCKHIEAVLEQLGDDLPAHTRKKKAVVTRPEIDLAYGEQVSLRLHLPARHSDHLGRLAKRFFDDKGLWSGKADFEALVPAVQAVPEEVTVLSDAMEHLDREIERTAMEKKEAVWLLRLEQGALDLQLLSVPLYDYQMRGAIFLACRGRAILADDMGLGKTVQTLAAVELLVRERGIARVLVVAPASVKYQWAEEIRRFTSRSATIVEGSADEREAAYVEPSFYRLVNYEQVVRDREAINAWKPDLVVLDEAQRIKNWEAKTSREVKKLKSRYAFVLTGTPLENKLEELYSIVSFVDERRFGPAFQFLHDHRVLDEDGKLVGYRKLDKIREKLGYILLRRTRAELSTQLPARTDGTVFVELNAAQRDAYDEQRTVLARLLGQGALADADRRRVLAALVRMRTICNGLPDDDGRLVGPKLDEFAALLPELLQADTHRRVVVFSQWETMLNAAVERAKEANIGYVVLHGGLSGAERQEAIARFRTDPSRRVFFGTDAAGVGLNLQTADTVINLELPWNPAVLEQRIARVHRLGQDRPVRAIHFAARNTIEDRVLAAIRTKRELFQGLFSGDEDELSFNVGNHARFLDGVAALLDEHPPAEAAPTIPSAEPQSSETKPAAVAPIIELFASALRIARALPTTAAERAELRRLMEDFLADQPSPDPET